MSVDRSAAAAKLRSAEQELEAAEGELDRAISALRDRDRAHKEIIAPAIETAFARVVAARKALGELERFVNDDG